VDVLAHSCVVDQIPAWVIGIGIDHELVTGPAPRGGDRPVIVSNLELGAGKPDATSAKVDAIECIDVRRSREREPTVLEWTREAQARIIHRRMSVPLIVPNIWDSGGGVIWLKHRRRVCAVAGRRFAWDCRMERRRCARGPPSSATATGLCGALRRKGYRDESGGDD